MVSCPGELFRRKARDETFGGEMRVISISGKLEDLTGGLVPRGRKSIAVPAKAHNHRALLSVEDDYRSAMPEELWFGARGDILLSNDGVRSIVLPIRPVDLALPTIPGRII